TAATWPSCGAPSSARCARRRKPVEARRVVVEERALLGRRPVGDEALEGVEQRAIADAEPIHREVAREHAALRAEDRNGLAHDLPVALHGPGLVGLAEAGDLERHGRLGGRRLTAPAPRP